MSTRHPSPLFDCTVKNYTIDTSKINEGGGGGGGGEKAKRDICNDCGNFNFELDLL